MKATKVTKTMKAIFKSRSGNHHTDTIGMSEEMLEKLADRITTNFGKTNKLDLSFFGTTKLKWLEDLLLGYNPKSGRLMVVTEVLAVRLWTLIFNKIQKEEYLILGFDLVGINESAYNDTYPELKEYIDNKQIKVKKKENGISYSTIGIRGIQERVLGQRSIEFVELNIQSDCYMWEDIDHSLEVEFNLWLNQDYALMERYTNPCNPCNPCNPYND